MDVMFDTNVFNHLLEGKIAPEQVPSEWTVHATHIQADELERTTDQSKRVELQKLFTGQVDKQVPTEAFVFDVSRLDQAKFSGPESKYGSVLQRLESLRSKRNNVEDALIADTCIQNGYVLVTNDKHLKTAASAEGCTVVDLRTPKP